MIKNKKWSSLLLAMWLVIVISLLAYTMLEYVIPFSRSIRWIENSSKAYYQANSWIEEGLYKVYLRNGSWIINNTDEYLSWFSSNTSAEYKTYSSWSLLPPIWEWNSEFDEDWNIISSGLPVQLVVWNWMLVSDFEIAFRVPNLDDDILSTETLSWGTLEIVNWQLSSNSNSLYASGSIIKASEILNSDEDFSNASSIMNNDWRLLNWWTETFNNFYTDECDNSGSWCILKFSVVNKLETSNSISIPYLEWKIDFDTSVVPRRYTKIEAWWKANWYKKWLEVKIAWQTVNEAFDFTVFQ